MTDEIDRQVERDELFLDAMIAVRKPVIPPTGRCYNCDEPVTGLFCDADCRDDYAKAEYAEAQRPR